MLVIDDQPVIDPKIAELQVEIPELIHAANRLIKFRVFKTKRGWEHQQYSQLKYMRNWMLTVIGLAKLVTQIYNRHPKEVWDRYKAFGIKGLTEQTELNKRQQNLEIYLNKNKPEYIVKGKPSKTAKEVEIGTVKTEN